MSNIDAVACVKKHLVASSIAHGLNVFIITGVMASIFTSKPIQIMVRGSWLLQLRFLKC